MGFVALKVTEGRQVAGPNLFSFGKTEEEKELEETTGGGFARPRSSFFRPTAESIKERVRGGLGRLKSDTPQFKRKSFSLSPAISKVKKQKFKKSQVEKLIGI